MSRMLSMILSLMAVIAPLFSGTESSGGYGIMKRLDILFNKNAVISEQHTGEKSTDVFDESKEFTFNDTVTLKKERDGDFKILTLDDIHFSDYGYRIFTSDMNVLRIRNLVKQTKPDLIILPGDFVCGESDYYSIQRITNLLDSFKIPWAPVFGNHDDEANCDLNFLADTMMKSQYCLMQKGDSRMGVGNYIIRVAEDDGSGNENNCQFIFMMDSHHSQPNEIQQAWFKWASDGINRLTDGKSEISLFMHIPLPEYKYVYDEGWDREKKEWKDGYNGYGTLHESVACERDGDGNPVQRGFFDIIKESGTAKYVFCGHDHMNDYSAEYEGVRLTYLMKLGISSGFQFGFNGGSVITIGSDGISRITHRILVLGLQFNLVDISL